MKKNLVSDLNDDRKKLWNHTDRVLYNAEGREGSENYGRRKFMTKENVGSKSN
jgi:hypothetical protein